jgi:hypothetical protein
MAASCGRLASTDALTTLLTRTTKSPDFETTVGDMFGFPAGRSSPPQPKRGWLELLPHQLNNLAGGQTKLIPNRIEAGPILPCHLNDPIDFGSRKDLGLVPLHVLSPFYSLGNRKMAHQLTALQHDGPQEAKFTREDLLCLPAPIRLAKEVGKGLGSSSVLQRSLSPRSVPLRRGEPRQFQPRWR